jgi:RNA polymerase sigma factor (sigma-70 family)
MRDPLSDPAPLIRKVYAYVAYRVGVGAEAEDITSDTIERALRYRESFDPRRGDAGAWVIGIARRCIADAARRDQPMPEVEPSARDATDRTNEIVERLDLHAAVLRLNGRDRELVALRFGADLTARQIGELLDMKTNAVEVALHRAVRALSSLLETPDSPAAEGGDAAWTAQRRT